MQSSDRSSVKKSKRTERYFAVALQQMDLYSPEVRSSKSEHVYIRMEYKKEMMHSRYAFSPFCCFCKALTHSINQSYL